MRTKWREDVEEGVSEEALAWEALTKIRQAAQQRGVVVDTVRLGPVLYRELFDIVSEWGRSFVNIEDRLLFTFKGLRVECGSDLHALAWAVISEGKPLVSGLAGWVRDSE